MDNMIRSGKQDFPKHHISMNKLIKRKRLPAVLALLLCLVLTGCTGKTTADPIELPVAQNDAAALNTTAAPNDNAVQGAGKAQSDSAGILPTIDENGVYTSRDDVALYLHTYGRLPSNFMTKKEAKKLGWSGGSLEDYAPGMCIGGDYFGNYEGLLPEDKEYRECDIDTLGKSSRGAKRIIYSDDGYIYYTADHYESFEQLYEP